MANPKSITANPPEASDRESGFRRAAFRADDAALVLAIRAGDESALSELYERYAPHVRNIVLRLLGADSELPDLIQEVFAIVIRKLPSLSEPRALKEWLASITVHVVRRRIRSRSRRRWLSFLPSDEVPEPVMLIASDEVNQAVVSTYAILDQLPADERIAFSMRFIANFELVQIAHACNVSLATIKRRISRAESKFQELARRDELLCKWMDRGSRWGKA